MRRGVLILVAAAALAAAAAGPARAEVVWLCEPTLQDNPCRDSLETTVYDPQGNSRVENPPLPADPPVDCFYVYPTVSEQPSQNANKDRDPEVIAIARFQASRFSQVCRVYAPMYRQQTLVALGAGGSPEALQTAYSDVEEAWRHYLATRNGGRGVILLGHSQGTRMLRQLVRKEIDGDPAVRGRILSAILLGGNVTVRRGQLAGGDFRNLPACTSEGQTGCVIAFSTFNETPPSNARYGRVPAEDTSGMGFPAGPDYEVLCTNPASLGANRRAPLHTLLRGEPFPGFIGLLMTEMYGGPQPSAPTPFLRPQDHYTGRCESREGANVLMLEPVDGARRLNPAPEPSWGLHLADGNIALGDLVSVAAAQIGRYQTSRTVEVRAEVRVRVRPARSCRVRLTFKGADRRRLRSVQVRRGGRVIARDRRAPFAVTVRASRRTALKLRIRLVLQDGRRARLTRTVPRCN